jgi:hypothetical protein
MPEEQFLIYFTTLLQKIKVLFHIFSQKILQQLCLP